VASAKERGKIHTENKQSRKRKGDRGNDLEGKVTRSMRWSRKDETDKEKDICLGDGIKNEVETEKRRMMRRDIITYR